MAYTHLPMNRWQANLFVKPGKTVRPGSLQDLCGNAQQLRWWVSRMVADQVLGQAFRAADQRLPVQHLGRVARRPHPRSVLSAVDRHSRFQLTVARRRRVYARHRRPGNRPPSPRGPGRCNRHSPVSNSAGDQMTAKAVTR